MRQIAHYRSKKGQVRDRIEESGKGKIGDDRRFTINLWMWYRDTGDGFIAQGMGQLEIHQMFTDSSIITY